MEKPWFPAAPSVSGALETRQAPSRFMPAALRVAHGPPIAQNEALSLDSCSHVIQDRIRTQIPAACPNSLTATQARTRGRAGGWRREQALGPGRVGTRTRAHPGVRVAAWPPALASRWDGGCRLGRPSRALPRRQGRLPRCGRGGTRGALFLELGIFVGVCVP